MTHQQQCRFVYRLSLSQSLLAGQWGRAGVAWLRFMLARDESLRLWFQAPGCTLCSSPWMGMSRNI